MFSKQYIIYTFRSSNVTVLFVIFQQVTGIFKPYSKNFAQLYSADAIKCKTSLLSFEMK